jgi:uncharacterized protein
MSRASFLMLAFVGMLTVSGCASPPSHFYRLTPVSEQMAPDTSSPKTIVMLRPMVVSEAANKPMLVVKTGPSTYRLEEQERWVEPLSDGIERVLRADLAALSPSVSYVGDDVDLGLVHYALSIDIDNLEGAPNGRATIDARYYLINRHNEWCFARSFHWQSEVGSDYGALVMAYSEGLNALAKQVGADVVSMRVCQSQNKEFLP